MALLLRGEERDGGLGCNGSTSNGFSSGNGDETVTVRFPGEVDNSVLETVDNLDRNTLLAHAENLEVGGERLLGLGVTVDLDTNVGTLGLPVQLDIGNVEEVTGTDNLLGRNAHHTDSGGAAAHFRCPEAQQLFVLLDTLALGRRGGPLKVHHTINLNGRLTQQVHPRRLVDRNRLALEHSGNVLLISGPLECGPLHLLLRLSVTLACRTSGQVVRNERPQRLPGSDIPNNDVFSILLVGQDRLTLFDLNRASGPGGHITLIRREFDQLHKWMGELLLFRERRATPELNTLGVDGGEESTLGRPLYEQLCPVGTVDHILGLVVLVIPENTDLLAPEKGELVASVGVAQPRAQVLLLLERLDGWRLVLLFDTSFTAIAIDIHQLVHGKGVLLVQGDTVELLNGGDGLFGRLVLDEGKTIQPRINFSFSLPKQSSKYPFAHYVPFGHVLVVDGHKNGIFGGVADRAKFPQQELDELLPALFRNDRKAIDDDKCIQTLLEFNFVLRLEIWWMTAALERGNKQSEKIRTQRLLTREINLLLNLLLVEVLLGKGIETGRHLDGPRTAQKGPS